MTLEGTDVSGAFVADEDILHVESVAGNKITVTAMRGGKSQILFWREGSLQFLDVVVRVPPSLTSAVVGPRFQGTKPYFTYEVQNTSHFSKSTFFTDPGTAHTLQMDDPIRSHGRLRANFGMRHDGLETPEWVGALVSYQDPTRYLTFGQTATILGRVGNDVISSTAFLGSNLSFRSVLRSRSRFQRELNIFGGVRPSLKLLDSDTSNQIFGTTASAIRYIPGRQKPDVVTVSAFAYQPLGIESYKPSVLAEGQYHLTKDFSLGLSALRVDGGVSGMANPFWETDRSTSSLKYSYIQHGLRIPLAAPTYNDLHRYSFFHQHLLTDRSSTVGGSVSQDFSFQKDNPLFPDSNNLRGTLYYRKQQAFQRGYGVQYGISRSAYLATKILLNSVAVNHTHPVKPGNYFQHNLAYTRGDLSILMNQVTASSSFTHEGPALRSTTSLGTLINRGDSRIDSIFFQESFLWNFRHGFYQMGFGYLKADVSNGNHQFQFSPSWNYYLASNHLVSLGTNFIILAGDPRETIGALNLRYRYLFGPGVEKESPFRNMFRGGMNQPVQGNLFIDRNYSAYYDEGDTPLAGIPVRLGDRIVSTDASGRFEFSNVRSGQYLLSLDPNHLGIQQPVDIASQQNINIGGRSTQTQPVEVPIPVTVRKAEIHVKVFMDVNGNGDIDAEDPVYLWPKVLVSLPSGEQRRVSMNSGEAIVRGIDPGLAKISLDPSDIPDTVEISGPLEKDVTVSHVENLDVDFLVTPLRMVRGRLSFPEGYKRTKKLFMTIGESRSEIDAEGYFWVKNLRVGAQKPYLSGDKNLCLENAQALEVPQGPYMEIIDYRAANGCAASPSP